MMRCAMIGLLCDIVSSPLLCLALRSVGLGLALGALLGIAQVFAFFDLEGGSAIDRAMTCAWIAVVLHNARLHPLQSIFDLPPSPLRKVNLRVQRKRLASAECPQV
jgi:hypothetical protein